MQNRKKVSHGEKYDKLTYVKYFVNGPINKDNGLITMSNQTEEFLGHWASWNRIGIELDDVQPLHGGVRVALPTYSGSTAIVTRVAPGGKEKKFRLRLEWQEKESLCRLFVEQDFLTTQPEERTGLPDEARPSITLTNRQREHHTVAKWSGVVDARFDVLYDVLRALSQRTKRVQEIKPKLSPWQKGLFLGGLAALLLVVGGTAVWLARQWVTFAQPGWLFWGMAGLLALAVVGLRLLGRRERRFSPWLRPFTNPWLLALFSLLLFGGGIGIWGMIERWQAARKTGTSVALDAFWDGYAVWGYTAVFTLYILLILTAFLGKKILRFVDERF